MCQEWITCTTIDRARQYAKAVYMQKLQECSEDVPIAQGEKQSMDFMVDLCFLDHIDQIAWQRIQKYELYKNPLTVLHDQLGQDCISSLSS